MRWLSPGGARGRLSVFIFHRVLPEADPLLPDEPDAARFDAIVAFLARHYRILPLADAVRAHQRGTLPPAAACITFDDGYADNLTVAAPILRRHGATATFFIATGFIDGGRMWNDTVIEAVRRAPAGALDWRDLGLDEAVMGSAAERVPVYGRWLKALKHLPLARRTELTDEIARRAGLPARGDLMMTVAQLRELHGQGMEIGGHTVSHPILCRLDGAAARDEIGAGREQLAAWLGTAPEVFAYPNGVPGADYGPRDVALVRAAGFIGAVTTAWGAARPDTDAFELPRFLPWDRSMLRFGLRSALTLLRDRPHPAAAEPRAAEPGLKASDR